MGGWGPTWGGGDAPGTDPGGGSGPGVAPVPTLGSRPAMCPPWGYSGTGDSLVTNLGVFEDRGLPCHQPGGVRDRGLPCHQPGGTQGHGTPLSPTWGGQGHPCDPPRGLMDRVTPLHPLWGILRDRGQRCDQPGRGRGTGDTPHTHLGGRGATRTPSSLPHMPCPPPLSPPPSWRSSTWSCTATTSARTTWTSPLPWITAPGTMTPRVTRGDTARTPCTAAWRSASTATASNPSG